MLTESLEVLVVWSGVRCMNSILPVSPSGGPPGFEYSCMWYRLMVGSTAICSSSGGSSEFITLVSLWKKKNTGF